MDRDVYLAMIIIGMLPVVGAVVHGGAIGSGVTLCILVVVAGFAGLVREVRRLPRARIVKRR